MHIITRGLQPKEALEVLTKAVKRENATKLDLFGGEKNEFPPQALRTFRWGRFQEQLGVSDVYFS